MTRTLADVTADLDADDLLKTLDPPKCEHRNPEACGKLAEWFGQMTPCKCQPSYLCNGHKEHMQAIERSARVILCSACKAKATVQWVKL